MSTTTNQSNGVKTESDRKYKDETWLRRQLREKGRTKTEIAAQCGVSSRTIGYWCEKFGIKEPDTATFRMDSDAYEQWYCGAGGEADVVSVHRLLATLKVDKLNELDGKEVHHKSGVPWDNRPDNIEVLSPSEHRQRHTG